MATKPKTRKAAAKVADPIFAAIAEHKAKEKEWLRLSAVLDAAEGEACKTHGKRPLSVTQQFNTTTIDLALFRTPTLWHLDAAE